MRNAIICRDILNKKLINVNILDETENIKYSLEEVPEIEDKAGEIGQYVLLEDGSVGVEYTPIPPSEMELMQKKLEEQDELIADLMLLIAGGVK